MLRGEWRPRRSALPELLYVSPHLALRPPPRADRRVKVGFASAYLRKVRLRPPGHVRARARAHAHTHAQAHRAGGANDNTIS